MSNYYFNKALDFVHEYHDSNYISEHLLPCVEVAKRFNMYYDSLQEDMLLSCVLLHDILEDTSCSRERLEQEFTYGVGFIVSCVTDEPGRNRKERKLNSYWKIRMEPFALFVKLCDRIQNVERCVRDNRPLLDMYRKEHYTFKCALYSPNRFSEMWKYLDTITT